MLNDVKCETSCSFDRRIDFSWLSNLVSGCICFKFVWASNVASEHNRIYLCHCATLWSWILPVTRYLETCVWCPLEAATCISIFLKRLNTYRYLGNFFLHLKRGSMLRCHNHILVFQGFLLLAVDDLALLIFSFSKFVSCCSCWSIFLSFWFFCTGFWVSTSILSVSRSVESHERWACDGLNQVFLKNFEMYKSVSDIHYSLALVLAAAL